MRVLAIGDIHGCLGPLDDLLAWVRPEPDDVLITLGDYVDRGPDSRGVLNRLIDLKKTRPVTCLRGNHELMMLDAWRGGHSEKKMWLSVGGVQTLGSYGPAAGRTGTFEDVPADHWHFLQNELVDYHESDQFIFVHAGVLGGFEMHEQPDYALFWDFLGEAMRHRSGKTVICGHTSQKTGQPKVVPGAVCIDTYAHGGGWLTCLDAISGRYWQVDALGRKRDGRVDYRNGEE
ncbi:metallophosphoesterase family protein [Frigoriglobus tundricola]|uniref:Serine/threonine protein phosphatase n=1 Tax=Frigoriglobus tundricola TaxID=2774151 RepID=A0A6M5YYF2_9BACT|nr:metallophosphoesterase family protein [Frigoriglobus tundricola]QJW97942.1 Serine/threonine protein phosphatase [Frigoriglobus tundricola]